MHVCLCVFIYIYFFFFPSFLVSNLALVKPEKTKAVENYLIQMAWYGQLSGKVSEQGLIEILEKVSQQTEKKTTVKVSFPQSTRQKKD